MMAMVAMMMSMQRPVEVVWPSLGSLCNYSTPQPSPLHFDSKDLRWIYYGWLNIGAIRSIFFARTIFFTIVFFSAVAQTLQNYSILSQERYQSSAKLRRLDKERGGGPGPGPTLEAAVAYWRKQKEGESVWEWVGGTILLIASHLVRCFNGKYKYTEIQKVQNYKYEIGAPFF